MEKTNNMKNHILNAFVKKMLKKNNYFEIYLSDIIITGFTFVFIICVYSYLNVKKKALKIKREWPKYRCNPAIIPIAGFINARPGSSISEKIEFTKQNNEMCANEILEKSREKYLDPVSRIQTNLAATFSGLSNSIDFLKSSANKISGPINIVIDGVYNVMASIIINLQHFFIKIRNILTTGLGVVFTIAYSYLGVLLTKAAIFFATSRIILFYLGAFSGVLLILQHLSWIPGVSIIYFILLVVYIIQLVLGISSLLIMRAITMVFTAEKVKRLIGSE